MASDVYSAVEPFMKLYSGLTTAFGTGKGSWVKRPATKMDFTKHLLGEGHGIGIAPLRPDNTVMFAAIDLDEPDFDAAHRMQEFIPGRSFVEHSRSGNAHILVFFKAPCPAWVAMGLLKEATYAAGKQHVEVFPKNHDFAMVKLGNYINLSYHGNSRRIESPSGELWENVHDFLNAAFETAQDPYNWIKRADLMGIPTPEQRTKNSSFGDQSTLHICAREIIEDPYQNPVVEGHRAAYFFALSKQLTNWNQIDTDEALEFLRSVNSASPDAIPDSELRRILGNAERGRFTSTGCDDPLFIPYAHPDCPIAHPRS